MEELVVRMSLQPQVLGLFRIEYLYVLFVELIPEPRCVFSGEIQAVLVANL